MREITLTNGGAAVVDDEDFASLAAFNWQRHRGGYAYRYQRTRPAPGRAILMHREIVQPAPGMHVDHIDGDGLNNQRANLRACTRTENLRNQRTQRRAGKSSAYKGVYFNKHAQKWIARVGGRSANRHLGTFDNEIEAAHAYDAAALALYGEYARLNVYPEGVAA